MDFSLYKYPISSFISFELINQVEKMIINRDNKVLSLEKLAEKVERLKKNGQTIAMCHGCFDILHVGHLRHLEAAKKLADILIITITPDRFVNKGPNRPVFPEYQRAELLAGLNVVDLVAINKWDSAIETIRIIKPNIFIKGQEYETHAMQVNPNFISEAKVVGEIGAKIAFTHELTSSSTSAFKRLTEISK